MDKERLILRSAKNQKEHLKDFFVSTIVLASCVNVLATSTLLFLDLEKSKLLIVIISIFFIVITLLLHFIFRFKIIQKKFITSGVFIYNDKYKKIINIDGYEVSYDMCKYLNSALQEDSQLKETWNSGGLEDFNKRSGDKKIINELIEYCIIEQLSVSLSDYFQKFSIDDTGIFEVNSDNIEPNMLTNRFLKLFSTNIKSRVAVDNGNEYSIPSRDDLICSYTKDGFIYEKIHFSLPKNTKLQRVNENSIVIRMPMFDIFIDCHFYGFNTNLPHGFSKYFLKIKDYYSHHNTMEFEIEVRVEFKTRYYLSGRGWEYHEWVDDFIENVEKYASDKFFFEKINWETVYTTIQCNTKI